MPKVGNSRYNFFDEVRDSTPIPPSNRTDVIEITDEKLPPFNLRHFTLFVPLLVEGSMNQFAWDVSGAVILALHHFNNGIASIVPKIKDVEANCNLKFSTDVIDTHYSPMKSSRALMNDVVKRASGGNPTNPLPTAIIGAARSAVSSPMGILTGLHGIPQMSYASTSTVFDDKSQYPLFGRLIPSANGDAQVALEYLQRKLGVTHLGVLYVRDAYGSSYALAIQTAAKALEQLMEVFLSSFTFDVDSREREIKTAVRELAKSDVRYFLGIFFPVDYDTVMSEAYRCEIAGAGRFWLFADSLEEIPLKTYSKSQTALVETTHGAALITLAHASTRIGRPEFDNFLDYWQDLQLPEVRSYVDSKMPSNFVNAKNGTILEQASFSAVPGPYAVLSYDTTIALAFAACEAQKQNKHFDGQAFYKEFLNVSFDGLFGQVAVDPHTGTRDYESVPYTISNIVSKGPDENDMISFSLHPTDVIHGSGNGQNTDHSWQHVVDFVYSDNTTNPPPPLPPLQHNPNLIGTAGRVAGLVMCGMVCILSIVFSWWTWKNRSSPVVKAAQPIFLNILTGGTFLISCTIIPMGMEEPLSDRGLDMSCMAMPWLFSTGFAVTFSALFAKTLRINRILHHPDLQRITLKPRHVMKPAVLLLTVNILILSVWTAVAPLQYERFYGTATDNYGRPTESFAMCVLPPEKTGAGLVMLILLICSNLATLVFALDQVWKARNIDTDFSESQFIALATFSFLQTFLIALPLFFVVNTMPLARYIVFSAIIFLMCQAILLLIFLPKMLFHRDWKQRQIKRELRRKQLEVPSWLILSKTASSRKVTRWSDGTSPGQVTRKDGGCGDEVQKGSGMEEVGDSAASASDEAKLSLDVGEQLVHFCSKGGVKSIWVPQQVPVYRS